MTLLFDFVFFFYSITITGITTIPILITISLGLTDDTGILIAEYFFKSPLHDLTQSHTDADGS